jgi:hypothetical protein
LEHGNEKDKANVKGVNSNNEIASERIVHVVGPVYEIQVMVDEPVNSSESHMHPVNEGWR